MIAIGSGTRISPLAIVLGCLLLQVTLLSDSLADDLQAAFKNPPTAARPWAFWYWNKGAISRDGITADLEAMSDAGIGGAYLMSIKGPDVKLWDPPIVQLTPAWWDMLRHAMSEADRLGLKIAMHACDGFATAGGPWITPDKSMQQLVWTETILQGGKEFSGKTLQPPTIEGFYRDIAVFAYPAIEKASGKATPRVTASLANVDAQFLASSDSRERIRFDEPGWIQYEFSEPFLCRSVTIHPDGNSFQANRLAISVSDDGKEFSELVRLEPPRHGWQNGTGSVTHSIPPTTARFFRFTYDTQGTEPGGEDLDSAKWKPSLKVRSIILSNTPRIHQFEGKNGQVWRVSRRTTAEQVPAIDCIPLDKIINITEHFQKDGTLDWQIPDGEWTILRIGHTSTGTHNETGGGGRGLECDKFDPEIVRFQFDNWFGKIIRQVGPELASRVLKIFHVDSWECGSQNWSNVFPEEFKRRRGYDLLPYLPVLTGIPITSADLSERILYDVRQTIAELVVDNCFKTLAELSREHGCEMSAECVSPTMVSDGMRHFSAVDIPMGEFWLRSPTHDKPNDMLDAISAAHVYGKPIVQAEAFTELRMAWDEHPGLLKALGDRQLCLGANRLVYHVFNHNPWLDRRPGMTLDQIGLYFQRDQTWWPAAKAWTGYHARCQAMLQAGVPVIDIAVFTGEEIPTRAVLPETLTTTLPGILGREAVGREEKRLANVGTPQRTLPVGVNASANMTDPADWLDLLRGYNYDSINSDALVRLAKADGNRIQLPGGASYQLLVMPMPRSLSPHPELMSPAVAKKLSDLVERGASVVACVHAQRSPSLVNFPEDDDVLRTILGRPPIDGSLTRQAVGTVRKMGAGQLIYGPIKSDSFAAYGIEPDFLAFDLEGKRLNNIAWNHRRSPAADWYFLSNQSEAAQDIIVTLRETGKQPEIWDPLTAEIQAAKKWRTIDGRTRLTLRLEPYGSLFIVLRDPVEVAGRDNGDNWLELQEISSLKSLWTVKFDKKLGGPAEPVEFLELHDWSTHADERIRNYSGTATYRQSFDWNGRASKRVWLDLGRVANVAAVELNNIACGIAWTPPYRIEITDALQKGLNELSIAVTNTWANRLIGDAAIPAESRITWTTAPPLPADAKLLPAGLLGPVRLMREVNSNSSQEQ